MQKKLALIISFILVISCLFTGCGHAKEFNVSNDTHIYCDFKQITDCIWVDQSNGVLYYRSGYERIPLLNEDGTPKNINDFQHNDDKTDISLEEDSTYEVDDEGYGRWVANTPRIGNIVLENDLDCGPGYFFSNSPDVYSNAYVENKTLHYNLNRSDGTVDKETELLADDFHFYVEFCDYTCRQGGDYCDTTYMELPLEDGLKLINEQPQYGGEMTHICFEWNDEDNLIDAGDPDNEGDDTHDYKYLSSITLVWHLNSDWN